MFWLLPLGLAIAAAGDAVIVRPVANMHSRSTEDSDVVSQAIYATPDTMVEKHGDWIRIRTPDAYLGWVPAAATRPGTYAASGKVATVSSLMAHIYREASVTRHAPVLTLPFESKLEVIAEPPEDDSRWIHVRLADDRSGWIQRGDVSFHMPLLQVSETLMLAKRFLGLPYTWGGTSSFGYDCSGYTQMLCRRMGKHLPRDAQPQAAWDGVFEVAKADLQPGDLLYFGPSSAKITHTGMYMGAGEFIHATAHVLPAVQISRLDDPHWTKLLVACRRLK